MAKYRIGWLPGDGIGAEVLQAARIVLDESGLDAEYIQGAIGWEYWKSEGDPLPPRTVELLHNVNAVLFGAVTSKPMRVAESELMPHLRGKGLVYRSPIVRMRQVFDLYACYRPCKSYAGNDLNYKEGIDLVIFRENSEDLYAGVEFSPVPAELAAVLSRLSKPFGAFQHLAADQFAISCKINTRKASERIVRAGFEFARKHKRRRVTIVHKANVVRATDGLFLEAARNVAKSYPEIPMDEANVDAMAMWLLKNPFNYDMLVAPNLYGDIISDLCAQMVGGLGFGCSASMGDRLAVFEPTHGSAPKYAGKQRVNPVATILAAKMMLDWLGETEKAQRVERAVADVIRERRVLTYDMGGNSSTLEMAEAIARKVSGKSAVPANTALS
jgi:isocitrate/isopropylmalate dehydrogenase